MTKVWGIKQLTIIKKTDNQKYVINVSIIQNCVTSGVSSSYTFIPLNNLKES